MSTISCCIQQSLPYYYIIIQQMPLKNILKYLQIVTIVLAQIALPLLDQFIGISHNSINIILISQALTFIISIFIKILRMYKSNTLKYFPKTQISFIIPYTLLISQIYLLVKANQVDQQYFNQNKITNIVTYISLFLQNIAYSLVCIKQTSSKLEYVIYLTGLIFQLSLLTLHTVDIIGTTPIYTVDQLILAALFQQIKDLAIGYLALYMGSTLIVMDYLNKSREVQKKKDNEVQMIQHMKQSIF